MCMIADVNASINVYCSRHCHLLNQKMLDFREGCLVIQMLVQIELSNCHYSCQNAIISVRMLFNLSKI